MHLTYSRAAKMPFNDPVSRELLRGFKSAGGGLPKRQAGAKIVEAILAHYKAEITVYNDDGHGELFRIGSGNPSHGIQGIHVHPISVAWGTWELKAHKDAVAFLTDDDFNMYLGKLLQALEVGRFRVGFAKQGL
jgi:hypothetical protein